MISGNIDVLIRGAKVVDGSGNSWFYGDVAISGERVLEVAPPESIPAEAAREVINAAGMVVCPGFIDILSHSHIPLMQDPRDLSKITQGVTTEIMGEGWTLREYAKGLEMGIPTPSELDTMRRVMVEAMEDGALGISYALIYPPDTYASTQELIEVAKVAGRYGGILMPIPLQTMLLSRMRISFRQAFATYG